MPGGGAHRRRPGRTVSFRPRRQRRWPVVPLLMALLVVGGGATAAALAMRSHAADTSRQDAARRFITAWERQDHAAMWRALSATSRAGHGERGFAEAYRAAMKAAGVRTLHAGLLGRTAGGAARVHVTVRTARFGTLRGTVRLPLEGSGEDAGVAWDASLRLPGLRPGEAVRLRRGDPPRRGRILAGDDSPLAADALGASIAGTVGPPATGLQRLY
ncbi:MAG: penicillin-binding protein transpeptidase, partial [Solirubrobacterales bacterium]|nr:penicillin-binding protein transpeptidase [Solirubrobacterales bacterium]